MEVSMKKVLHGLQARSPEAPSKTLKNSELHKHLYQVTWGTLEPCLSIQERLTVAWQG